MSSIPSSFISIPLAILIFENNGNYSYRAYSPSEFNRQPDVDDTDHRSVLFGQFLARIYNRIAYDPNQPLNNGTQFGALKEIHSRFVQIPIEQRGQTCYFSTYQNQHCRYNPIHRDSPVFFDQQPAANYQNQQPNLIHCSCSHEIV